jgi:DNA-binding winged helix-turn-helix (wHTH) protein/tetratricopeptide (TPR) repeat protein
MKSNDILAFAEFRIDVPARCLQRNSVPVPLNRRAFDVLLYFAQNPGRVVSKEELLKTVWPDSFVDENSLAQSISVLRKALREHSEESDFIVTLAGRGYQFVAPVESIGKSLVAQAIPERSTDPWPSSDPPGDTAVFVQERTLRTSVVTEEVKYSALPAPRSNRGFVALALLLVVAAIMAGAWVWRRAQAAKGPAAGPVSAVLADFENSTGEPGFDHALDQALQIDLEQTPYLEILSRTTVQETLGEMQRGKAEPLTPALAREVCERNNALVVLHGLISKFGGKYLVLLNADSCVSGKTLAGSKASVDSEEEVLNALDQVASQVRRQLGESAASLDRYQLPIVPATTPSLDALRTYSEARESFRRGDMKSTQTLLYRAVGFDPNFSSAYRILGLSYYNLSDYEKAAEFFKKAFDLRQGTTERERLSIETMYYAYSLNDLEEAVRRSRQFLQIYPDVAESWATLCDLLTQLGQYPQAVDAGERALRLDPRSGAASVELARAYMRANRFDDARRTAQAAVAEGKDDWEIHSILFQIAFWLNDAAAMKSEGEWGLSHQHANTSLYDLGFAAMARGRLREASDYFSRARTDSLKNGETEFADEVLLDTTSMWIELGEKRRAAANLKELRPEMGDAGDVAFLRASNGDTASAKQFLALGSVSPRDTIATSVNLPILRAVVALKDHQPVAAIEALEPARPYQLRDYSVLYWRARAETEAGMLEPAATDYRLILDNPGVNPTSPEYSLAHLSLARVLILQNKIEPARDEYRKLFHAWEHADQHFSLLQEANREFEKLP